MGVAMEVKVPEGVWGGVTNSKGPLEIHVETYYCGNFLRCRHKKGLNGVTIRGGTTMP